MKRNHLALCELLGIHAPETANVVRFTVQAYEHSGDRDSWLVDSSNRLRKPHSGIKPVFFVATSRYELSPRGGVFDLQHCFQLDLAQLSVCIDELCKDSQWATTLKEPVNIAAVFSEAYNVMQPHLIDFNEEGDDYPAIAKVLVERWGTPPGIKFGI